jgi:uncharacterized protein
LSRDGEPGHNYLCAGLELFFNHVGPTFNVMVQLLRQRRPPADVMAWVAQNDARGGPDRPCPCGSGRAFGLCHGDRTPASPFSGVGADTEAKRESGITGTGQGAT